MNEIKITTPFIKLDQFLKFCGIAYTGGEAKEMVADGIISVNGEVCKMRGKKLYPQDVIKITAEDGEIEFVII